MKEYDEDDDSLYVEMIMIMMKMRIIMKMTTTCMRRRRDDNQLQEVVWHPPHSLLFTGKVIIISFFSFIIITRSCAAIRAADLDWIQFGRVHFVVFSMSWGGAHPIPTSIVSFVHVKCSGRIVGNSKILSNYSDG